MARGLGAAVAGIAINAASSAATDTSFLAIPLFP
jgi:hypothetical protein